MRSRFTCVSKIPSPLCILKSETDFSVALYEVFRQTPSAEQVTKPLYTTAVKRWVNDLPPSDKETVKEVAGNLLVELGYAEDLDW